MNTNRPFNEREAFEIYLSLLDGYFSAAITEPRDIGETLANTAITLAQAFREKINQHQPEPLHLEMDDVELLGSFQISGRSVQFRHESLDSEFLIADCKKSLKAIQIVETLEKLFGIKNEET